MTVQQDTFSATNLQNKNTAIAELNAQLCVTGCWRRRVRKKKGGEEGRRRERRKAQRNEEVRMKNERKGGGNERIVRRMGKWKDRGKRMR
jgi:hypothetical protein